MKDFTFVLVLNLFLLQISFCFALSPLEYICDEATYTKEDYRFCVASLQAEADTPNATLAIVPESAVIACNLTIANFTEILAKIRDIKSNKAGLSHSQNASLDTCRELYDVAINRTKDAIASIKASYVPPARVAEFISFAVSNLTIANDAPRKCEEAFHEGHSKSLISREDDLAARISSLALSITQHMEQE